VTKGAVLAPHGRLSVQFSVRSLQPEPFGPRPLSMTGRPGLKEARAQSSQLRAGALHARGLSCRSPSPSRHRLSGVALLRRGH
jgi:hypothetical protein